nr:m7GpppN-mRNA hydrolase [Onthophagus taurus]
MEYNMEVELRTTQHSIPMDVLIDLIARFVINVPDTAKQNLIRICFQIELAYWYYLDFYVNGETKLRSCGFKEFAAHVFIHSPFLKRDYNRLDEILEEWREYKQSVPTYGAILLSEGNSHVLLVQGYWGKASWGFPKGKVNEDEDPAHCAVREVYEETGFDISSRIDPENYFEAVIHEQLVRLYVITGIPFNTKFQPRTRNEIKSCEWFPIADLPNNKKDNTPKVKMGLSTHSFYMVLPFVKRIKGLFNNKPKAHRQKSLSFSEASSTSRPKYHRSDSECKEIKDVKEMKEFKGNKERKSFQRDTFLTIKVCGLQFSNQSPET